MAPNTRSGSPYCPRSISTGAPVSGTDSLIVEDTLVDESLEHPIGELDRGDIRGILQQLLDTLPDREREILLRRFGFESGEIETLERVGERLSLSRERVRQLERIALDKLRSRMNAAQLEPSLIPTPQLASVA